MVKIQISKNSKKKKKKTPKLQIIKETSKKSVPKKISKKSHSKESLELVEPEKMNLESKIDQHFRSFELVTDDKIFCDSFQECSNTILSYIGFKRLSESMKQQINDSISNFSYLLKHSFLESIKLAVSVFGIVAFSIPSLEKLYNKGKNISNDLINNISSVSSKLKKKLVDSISNVGNISPQELLKSIKNIILTHKVLISISTICLVILSMKLCRLNNTKGGLQKLDVQISMADILKNNLDFFPLNTSVGKLIIEYTGMFIDNSKRIVNKIIEPINFICQMRQQKSDDFKKIYFNYQLLPIEHMAKDCVEKSGIFLYHFPGSGKSLTALGIAQNIGLETFIVCPSNLINQWKNDYIKVYSKYLPKTTIFDLSEIENFLKSKNNKWFKDKTLIFDEAHNLILIEHKFRVSLSIMLSKFKKRILLSATPIIKGIKDLSFTFNITAGENIIPIDEHEFRKQFFTKLKIGKTIAFQVITILQISGTITVMKQALESWSLLIKELLITTLHPDIIPARAALVRQKYQQKEKEKNLGAYNSKLRDLQEKADRGGLSDVESREYWRVLEKDEQDRNNLYEDLTHKEDIAPIVNNNEITLDKDEKENLYKNLYALIKLPDVFLNPLVELLANYSIPLIINSHKFLFFLRGKEKVFSASSFLRSYFINLGITISSVLLEAEFSDKYFNTGIMEGEEDFYRINMVKLTDKIKEYISFYDPSLDKNNTFPIEKETPIFSVFNNLQVELLYKFQYRRLTYSDYIRLGIATKENYKHILFEQDKSVNLFNWGRFIGTACFFKYKGVFDKDLLIGEEILHFNHNSFWLNNEYEFHIIPDKFIQVKKIIDSGRQKKIVIYSSSSLHSKYLSSYLNLEKIKHFYIRNNDNYSLNLNDGTKSIYILDQEYYEGISILGTDIYIILESELLYSKYTQIKGRCIRANSHRKGDIINIVQLVNKNTLKSTLKSFFKYTLPFPGKQQLSNLIFSMDKIKLDLKYRPHLLAYETLLSDNNIMENPDHIIFKRLESCKQGNKQLVNFMNGNSLEHNIKSINKKCTIKNNCEIKNIYEKSKCGKINSKRLL